MLGELIEIAYNTYLTYNAASIIIITYYCDELRFSHAIYYVVLEKVTYKEQKLRAFKFSAYLFLLYLHINIDLHQ